jgi:hypothetical protein
MKLQVVGAAADQPAATGCGCSISSDHLERGQLEALIADPVLREKVWAWHALHVDTVKTSYHAANSERAAHVAALAEKAALWDAQREAELGLSDADFEAALASMAQELQ